jgi:aminoglycoside 3-N-acetyltransferase
MNMDEATIEAGLRELGVQNRDVAVHSSLRSFGHVDGGAQTVVRALLNVCGTVVMPTFCEIGRTNPPPGDRPAQNGWDYEGYQIDTTDITG